MSKIWYYLQTFVESALSVVGVRGAFEQPAYHVLRSIPPAVEIRAYDARVAGETAADGGNDGAAFQRLFQYITGANTKKQLIAMTAPVEEGQLIAMTVPVEVSGGERAMRFFLPQDVAKSGAPAPTDPRVHIVKLPPVTLGVIRYSGLPTAGALAKETADLRAALARAGVKTEGPPRAFYYDPPFTLPFLRRNEVALEVAP